MKLNYPPLHFTRPELSALAARAQAGDADAFVLLIRGTIRLYWHIAKRIRVPPQYREDVIQDTIALTYGYILPRYNPGQCWVAFVGIALRRHMDRCVRRMAGPVTVSNNESRAFSVTLPAHAMGVVEPSRCHSGHVTRQPSALEQIERKSVSAAIQRELSKLTERNRLSLFYDGETVAKRFGVTKQAVNMTKQATLKRLQVKLRHLL